MYFSPKFSGHTAQMSKHMLPGLKVETII